MIKFFRKIRQKLLIENKFNRYLIYAIGEILLVVIGILIALQINNWNEHKNERILEKSILEKISENIANDIDQYEQLLGVERNIITQIDSFLLIIRNPSLYERDDLEVYVGYLRFYKIFIPNKSALTNLISSGKINIIENNGLLEHILEYYSSMDTHGAGVDAAISTFTRSELGPYIMNFDFMYSGVIISEHRKSKSLLEYHQDPTIDNLVSFKIKLINIQIETYEKQIIMAKSLLKEMSEEIMK